MSRFIPVLISLVVLQACSAKSKVEETAPAMATEEVVAPRGLVLIESNDCQTCHHINNKLVGPSYNAIAIKYETTDETTTLLIGKVIKGGSGVWGDMPMNSHPGLSEADAREMVQYILSLDASK